MEEELKKLLEERKRIDEQIKILRDGTYGRFGRVKLSMESWAIKDDAYHIAILSSHHEKLSYTGRKNAKWRTIISAKTWEEAIRQIPDLIHDLHMLYDMKMMGMSEESQKEAD